MNRLTLLLVLVVAWLFVADSRKLRKSSGDASGDVPVGNPAVKVWMGTWNSEMTPQTDDWATIQKWMGDAYNADPTQAADIFVFMTQEQKAGTEGPGKVMVDNDDKYEIIDSKKESGTTKPKLKNGFGLVSTAELYISIVAKKAEHRDVSHGEWLINKKTGSARPGTKLKGGVISGVEIGGNYFAFASVHLDAASEKNRKSNIRYVLGSLMGSPRISKSGNIFSRRFSNKDYTAEKEDNIAAALLDAFGGDHPGTAIVAGDLNYRILKDTTTATNNEAAYLSAQMADHTAGKWGGALIARDSYTSIGAPYLKDKFNFDGKDIHTVLPTYKRDKAIGAQSDCGVLATALSGDQQGLAAKIQACYFKAGNPGEKSGGTQIDIGWLDQILHYPGDTDKVTFSEYMACYECLGGDHLAISQTMDIPAKDWP